MLGDVTREKVTAIVVCHGRDLSFFADTLHALQAQIHQPEAVVVLVPSMEERFVSPVRECFGLEDQRVHITPASGANLAQMLAGADFHDADWLWLLHADSAPAERALDALLRAGEGSNRIAVVGPKQIAWETAPAPVLLEVGIRATRSGRRVPEVEPGERDQGQYDSRTDVLAVGTAGALVRRSAWDELGGLDPFLGPFGDGLEFSRRARRAGYRVVVEPQAVVRHGRSGLGGDRSFAERRRAQIYNALIAARPGAVVVNILGFFLLAFARSAARLVVKEPGLAWAELKAGLSVVTMVDDVVRGRRRLAQVSTVGPEALSALEAKPADIRHARRESRRSAKEAKILAERPDPLTIKARADLARHSRNGALITAAVSVLAAVAFFLPVFSSGVLAGGGLAADRTQAPDLARIIWTGWLNSGDGLPYAVDPLWAVLLPFLFVGHPFGMTLGALATGVLYLAMPAAALGAYLAAGRLTTSWVVRTVLSLAWIVAPSFGAALWSGQIGAVVSHVLLPVAVFAIAGAWRGSARNLGLAALVFGALAAAAPVFGLVAVLVAVLGLFLRPGQRKRWLWIPAPALAMLAPTLRGGLSPDLLFAQAGVPTRDQFVLDTGLAAAPLIVVVAVAALALVRLHRMWQIRLGWLISAAGLVVVALAPFAQVGRELVPGGYVTLGASTAVGYSIAWLGLWVSIVAGADRLRTAMRRRSFGLIQITGGLAMVALPLAVVAMGGRWVALAAGEPELGAKTPVVPALAEEAFSRNERVLSLTLTSEGMTAELWRGAGMELHEFTMARGLNEAAAVAAGATADAANIDFGDAVAGLFAGTAQAATALADHAINIVLVPPLADGDSPEFRAQLVGRLHTVPGLQYVTTGEAGTFWRVAQETRRISADGATLTDGLLGARGSIDPGQARTLTLAERADARWRATVGGTELEAGQGWNQTWAVPAGMSGKLTVSFVDPVNRGLVVAQLATMLASFVVTLPLRRRVGGIE